MAVSSLLSSSQITSLIQQASAAFQLPAATLQTQEQPIKAQIRPWGKSRVRCRVCNRRLPGLSDVQTLAQRTVTSSSDIVQANATNAASVGSYALSNIHLANCRKPGLLGLVEFERQSRLRLHRNPGRQRQCGHDQHRQRLVEPCRHRLGHRPGQCRGHRFGDLRRQQLSPDLGRQRDRHGERLYRQRHRWSRRASRNIGASGLTQTQRPPTPLLAERHRGHERHQCRQRRDPGPQPDPLPAPVRDRQRQPKRRGLDSAAQTIVQRSIDLGHDQPADRVLADQRRRTAARQYRGGAAAHGHLYALDRADRRFGASAGRAFTAELDRFPGFTSGGTVTFDDAAFQAAAESNYTAVAALLGVGRASNAAVSVQGVGLAPPGTYAVNVTPATRTAPSSACHGAGPRAGTGGVMTVTDQRHANGFSLQIQPGVTGGARHRVRSVRASSPASVEPGQLRRWPAAPAASPDQFANLGTTITGDE